MYVNTSQQRDIVAIIDCPVESFLPSTDTKTLFLFWKKESWDCRKHLTLSWLLLKLADTIEEERKYILEIMKVIHL